ncbi:hypothetical protein [Burkholderia gladioli]|uniref:hypothetical protein n=1 Tax=Burkholderia gladioli TaxID=28095 RepID=UPI00163F79A7|nr:hypothetical protein [Burkholderia gladioli]
MNSTETENTEQHISGLLSRLSLAASENIELYYSTYLKEFKAAQQLRSRSNTQQGVIRKMDFSKDPDILRFSLVFNDSTFLTIPTGKTMALVFPYTQQALREVLDVEQLSFALDNEFIKKNGLSSGQLESLSPIFPIPKDDENNFFMSDISPLINQGRLIVEPERAVMYLDKTENDGRRHWKMLPVNPDSPPAAWIISSDRHSNAEPFVFDKPATGSERSLFDIAVPYLSNVPYKTLARIIADEGDVVSSLRVSIQDALKEHSEGSPVQEVITDVVKPKVDMINRKLTRLRSLYAVTLGSSTVATMGLTYTALHATSSPVASLAAIAGAGGLGLIGREYVAWKEKESNVKDDPFYFFWRCKRSK